MAWTDRMLPQRGGFKLEITRMGWWLLGFFTLAWVLITAEFIFLSTMVPLDLMIGPPGREVPTPTSFLLYDLLSLQPLGSEALGAGPGFHWWQLITAPLVYPPLVPQPLLLAILGFVFCAAPVERMLGVRGFLQLWLVAAVGATVGGLAVALVLPSPPFSGITPSVLAVAIVCCMMTPEAKVPFLVVLPVRMKWVAAGLTAWTLVLALGLTGKPEAGAYSLCGMAAGYFFWRSGGDLDPRRWLRRRQARRNLRLAVDRAVDENSEQDDGPIYH